MGMSANGEWAPRGAWSPGARKRRDVPGALAPRRSARCLRTSARSDVSPSSPTRPQPEACPSLPQTAPASARNRGFVRFFSGLPRGFSRDDSQFVGRGHTAPRAPSPRGVRRDARDGGVVSARRRQSRGLPGPAVPHVASPPRASGVREKRPSPGHRVRGSRGDAPRAARRARTLGVGGAARDCARRG